MCIETVYLNTLNGNISVMFKDLKAKALANPKGKIVARGATGNDVNNVGSWKATDVNMDPIEDVNQGILRLEGKPFEIIASHDTLKPLLGIDSYNNYPLWFCIGGAFWFGSNSFPVFRDFIKFDDSADDNLIIITDDLGNAVSIETD